MITVVRILEQVNVFVLLQVPEFCPALDEEGVKEHSFDLILAFDEVQIFTSIASCTTHFL